MIDVCVLIPIHPVSFLINVNFYGQINLHAFARIEDIQVHIDALTVEIIDR